MRRTTIDAMIGAAEAAIAEENEQDKAEEDGGEWEYVVVRSPKGTGVDGALECGEVVSGLFDSEAEIGEALFDVDHYPDMVDEGGMDPAVFDGLWLMGNQGRLYLCGGDEIDGFDGPTLDALNTFFREGGTEDDLADNELLDERGLTVVPNVLKRWTPEDGYYSA